MFSLALVLLLQQAPVTAAAPEAPPPPPPVNQAAAEAAPATIDAEAPAAAPAGLLLPKTTPLVIAIEKELGSKISQAGETFPIRLVEAVMVDGVEVLPAGITGQGEVVHAKKAGLAGAAGELVLAARYLDLNGRRIELRSFRFLEASELAQVKGRDNISEVNTTMAVLTPLAIFIGGGNTNVAPGTVANAKTRNDELFERPAPAATEPAGAAEQQVEKKEELP